MKKRGDFFGNTVQLAAHLCDHAEADQILIADEVHSLCRSLEISFADLGEITARMEGTLQLNPGDTVELGFEPQHLYRFDAEGKAI